MRRLLAITLLTWKAALRFRLFWVLAALLLISVVGLPLLIKDDGSARGFTQILLTYTLSTISALLGLSTLWLACGTLARDIEECQMQMVAVKPIARWQIWLGKWLGLLSINAVLLAMSSAAVYGLLQWRATKLPPDQQATLRNEVLVARGSARERRVDKEIAEETDRRLKERLEKNPLDRADVAEVRKIIREQVKAEYQIVPPGYARAWQIDLSSMKDELRDRPLQLRIKFNTADLGASGTFSGLWQIGDPQSQRLWRSQPMSLAPDTFHEFEIPPNLFDEKGVLTVTFYNGNDMTLLFPLEDGFEVLYHEGNFGPNFARGIGIIFCWMALLATIGLSASSVLSFPVAAFVSLGMLGITLASGTMASAVAEGTIADYNAEKGTRGHSSVDFIVIPTFKAALKVINLAKGFSPVDSLSTGRSVTWTHLGLACVQIIGLLGGVIGVVGIVTFSRRELATAQGTQ